MNFFLGRSGYSLLAMAAMPEDGTYRKATDLAADLQIPGPYLAKLLQFLSGEGILESARGPGGGFRMARPAHRITLGEVVSALAATEPAQECLMGIASCKRRATPCALHAPLNELKAEVEQSIHHLTIRDIQILDLQHQRPNIPGGARGRTAILPRVR